MPDEAEFRSSLDANGILRAGALAPPAPAFSVFAQRADAFIDVAGWRGQARRFFDAELGLTVDKRYEGALPQTDAARIVIACKDEHGTRFAFARPRTEDDLRRADAAEARVGYGGLTDLAKRCKTVWLIEGAPEDRIALRIAAILASVLLGPILTPDYDALFGVKTARIKLGL